MATQLLSLAGWKFLSIPGAPLTRALAPVLASLSSKDLARAVREMDRAWRCYPSLRPQLAHPYARLLMRQGWDWSAAANLLSSASTTPSPQLHADLVHALRRSGQRTAAVQALDVALKRFAMTALIAREARAMLAEEPASLAGWAAITPAYRLRAETASGISEPVTFTFHRADGTLIAQQRPPATAPPAAIFTLDGVGPARGLQVRANGKPLAGGALDAPPDFALDGRVGEVRRHIVRGWARLGWCPALRPRLTIRNEAGGPLRAAVSELGDGRWAFSFDPRAAGQGSALHMDVLMPDGSLRPLPDSPLLLPRAAAQWSGRSARSPSLRRAKTSAVPARPIDVIIPVYRDHERTLTCIRAVCETAAQASSIIVIDDASPEPALSADLDALAAAGDIILLRNERNAGFAASVNRAMAVHPDHDAVLVNSDVVVFEGWLQRLRAKVYRDARTATATPLSDDDSIVGYGGASDDVSAAEGYDQFCALRQGSDAIALPVGVGFCIYIRRDCWEQTGPFDDAAFGRGYGEETDWCMRARLHGWRHVLADNVFVHHAGGRSFGAARPALLERSARLLNLRHPGYAAMVAQFLAGNPIDAVRRDLDLARLRATKRRFVLLTTLALPGGIDRAVSERSRQLRAEGLEPLVLQPVTLDDMRECHLRSRELDLRYLRFRIPDELRELRELLASLPLELIEIHHTLGLDPRVIEMLRGLRVPMDAHLHDYSWICPRVTLIGSAGAYCGEPAVATCEACVRRNGSNLPEPITVRDLRRRSARWLGSMRRVTAPSADTVQRIGRYFPSLPIYLAPNETFVTAGQRPLARQASKVRIATIGAIGRHKGYDVLLACARDAARRNLPLEFVLIGYSQDDARLMRTGRIFVTGPYRDEEIGYLLGREAPHAVFLPSVWPETWCYTLSHAITSGLPVAAFDIGAMGERLRQESGGTLFPMGLPPREINRRLIELGRDGLGADNSTMTTAVPASAARMRGGAMDEGNQRSNG